MPTLAVFQLYHGVMSLDYIEHVSSTQPTNLNFGIKKYEIGLSFLHLAIYKLVNLSSVYDFSTHPTVPAVQSKSDQIGNLN